MRSTFRLGFLLACVSTILPSPVRAAGVALPDGRTIEKVDFERHIMGLLGRMGCASGSCHGSFQGKGGLVLSLFGYDPAKDYQSIVRDTHGRRIDLERPDASLMLLKATGQAGHGGLTRFGPASWQYKLLREWIAQGATWTPGSGTVKTVRVTPGEAAFKKPGQTGRLKVEAVYADGAVEDITSLCDYRTNDDAVAEVSNLGVVKTMRPGDTSVIVSYRGTVLPVRVLVPLERPADFVYPQVPSVNVIDEKVFAKLRRLNIVPSELSGDAEFLRRVTIDTTGKLPTPEEVRSFLADKSPDKREKKIDALLAHPLHAALWATKFSDITGNNTEALEQPQQRRTHLSQMWHDWLRKRFEDNTPYDEMVKGILTATSRENGMSPEDYVKQVNAYEAAQEKNEATAYPERKTLDLFWRRQARVTPEEWGEKTAAAFLGVRLECAQCHKHPFDRWTQADYRSYAHIFSSVNSLGTSPASAKAFKEAQAERAKKSQQAANQARQKGEKVVFLPVGPLREVFVAPAGRGMRAPVDPDTGRSLPAKVLGGDALSGKLDADPRAELMEWMRRADNPFFARSFANRVWGHYFGVGIVHPVDDFSLANPPSNPALLDALAEAFVASKFDVRRLEKMVLMSRTYQLASKPNESNRLDKNNFSRSYVRPLMAEVVVDVLNDAMGTSEKWGPGEAAGRATARAIEVGSSRVQNQNVNYVFRVFGRPPRTSACDCERTMEPGLPQKLFLMADNNLVVKLRTGTNRVSEVLKEQKDDDKALDELFLAALGRTPTDAERKNFAAYRDKKKNEVGGANPTALRRLVFADAMWALVNTSEFIFNH